MNKNVGKTERIVRVVGGLALTSMAFWGPESPWFYLGMIPVVTGFIGWCPPYQLLGINTNKSCATDGGRSA
jgi:hypothetical protein